MSGRSVAEFFDSLSVDYTSAIERCFPRYREMLWALLEYLPDDQSFESILELGSGTGNLSILLSQAYPEATLQCVDLSADSLEVCRLRLGKQPRLTLKLADIRQLSFPDGSFDLVASSITLHHLSSLEKQALFRQLFAWLKPGGTLTFADQFSGSTMHIYDRHIANWKRDSLAAGASEDEFTMWMRHQQHHDHHDPLKNQLDWLLEAGFVDVDCTWRYLLWSVVRGVKPTDDT